MKDQKEVPQGPGNETKLSALPQLTLGQYRVGINFNPGGHELVNLLKDFGAKFIDQCKQSFEGAAQETAKQFITICQVEGYKTDSKEAKRCYELAVINADIAVDGLRAGGYEGAQNDMECAAMWAVKAATKPELPDYLNSDLAQAGK